MTWVASIGFERAVYVSPAVSLAGAGVACSTLFQFSWLPVAAPPLHHCCALP